MTKEEWAERLPLIQAFVEGKTIQYKWPKGGWADVVITSNIEFSNPLNIYRIKPEPEVLRLKVIWVSDDWKVFEEEAAVIAYCQRHVLDYEKFVEVVE